MKPISKEKIIAVNTVIHKHGLVHDKANIIDSFTNGRTRSSKEMYESEAIELLAAFNSKPAADTDDKKAPMLKKIFRMAHEINYITKVQQVDKSGKMVVKNDYSRLYEWVLKYGYLHKELRDYTYAELPKLVSQFEFGIFKHYIKGGKNTSSNTDTF